MDAGKNVPSHQSPLKMSSRYVSILRPASSVYPVASEFSLHPPSSVKKATKSVRFTSDSSIHCPSVKSVRWNLGNEDDIIWEHTESESEHQRSSNPIQQKPSWLLRKTYGLPNPIFLAVIITILLIIILVAVLAGTYGYAASHRKSFSSPSNSSSETGTHTSSTYFGSIAQVSRRGLASVGWTDTSGAINQRLYWRDNKSGLIIGKGWTGDSSQWADMAKVSSDATKLQLPATNTSIAAAIDDQTSDILVLYFNSKNLITGFHNGNGSTQNYTATIIPPFIQGADNSSLSCVFHSPILGLHGLPVFVWQYPDSSVWIQNGTNNANLAYKLPINATLGSSLSLIQSKSPETYGQLILFYITEQDDSVSLAVTTWTSNDNPQSGWSSDLKIVSSEKIDTATSIAAYLSQPANQPADVIIMTSSGDGSLTQYLKPSNTDSDSYVRTELAWTLGLFSNYTVMAFNNAGTIYTFSEINGGRIQALTQMNDGWGITGTIPI